MKEWSSRFYFWQIGPENVTIGAKKIVNSLYFDATPNAASSDSILRKARIFQISSQSPRFPSFLVPKWQFPVWSLFERLISWYLNGLMASSNARHFSSPFWSDLTLKSYSFREALALSDLVRWCQGLWALISCLVFFLSFMVCE